MVKLPGSMPAPMADAHPIGPVPADERFQVTVLLRPRAALTLHAVQAELTRRQYLTREQYAAQHGASAEDMEAVEAFARKAGLAVIERRPSARSIVLSGTAAQVGAAFQTGIERAAAAAFTPPDIARLYDFPQGLGGGYRSADLNTYFRSLNLPAPKVTAVSVDGGRNSPSLPWSADAEGMLDIEIAGAVAPGAAIAVYFAPNSEQGFVDAIAAAVHDSVNKPSVISISWGAPEKDWSEQGLQAMDQAFQAAAALGVTVCCAAGDAGSSDQNPQNGTPDGLVHADFPASSPYVLACGGTRLVANGGAIVSETVWNDDVQTSATGGGVSDVFALPAWQDGAHVPRPANEGARIGRGLPDVAGNASPSTGYRVRVDFLNFVVGGTSAVSPLWAGLVARFNQRLDRPVGRLNPLLYGPVAGQGAFHDIDTGNNGAYAAAPGWDACTGWGSPVGSKLLTALGG